MVPFQQMLDRIFMPVVVTYILYLIFIGYTYYNGMQYPVNKSFYDQLYLKKILIPAGILTAGWIFRLMKFPALATLVMAVPAGIFLVKTLIILLVWVFLAVVFILFGKS